MRIVDNTTFHSLPAGTVFTLFKSEQLLGTIAPLEVKQTGPGKMQSTCPITGIESLDSTGSGDWWDKVNAMDEAGAEFPVDLDAGMRLEPEPDDKYVIYSRDDVNALIDRLQLALKGE